MAVVVVNASRNMTREQVEPHKPAILALFSKLERRFPTDLTVHALCEHADTGRRDLWLILDGERLLAAAMTAVETIDATGVRILRMLDLAGQDISAWAAELGRVVEAHGDEQNVDFYAIEGREGWGPVIEPMGYRKHAVLWRKQAKRAA